MSFSATGNLLPGSVSRPDIFNCATFNLNDNPSFKDKGVLICKFNKLGYMPVVSTITGLGRTLLGTVHTIVHLARAIFGPERERHLQEACLGAKNIGRGLIEMIPIIGNITMIMIDRRRTNQFLELAKEQVARNQGYYANQAIVFAYGTDIAKLPIDEYEAAVVQITTAEDVERSMRTNLAPTPQEIVRIICNSH